MLEVENLSSFTRGFHYNGKELIFSAKQIRTDVPDSWLKPDGTIPYPGLLKLRRIINSETGEATRAYIPKIPRDENFLNPHQEWEYIFKNEQGEEFLIRQVVKFCQEHGLNHTSIRNYIKDGKKYKGWMITRRKLTISKENKDINTSDIEEHD